MIFCYGVSHMNKQWTVIELINETTGYFKKKGIETPRLDAELLLAHCRATGRVQLYTNFDRPVSEAEISSFRELVRRRAAGEPVAYLTGYREFWSLKIRVGKGVLIPRPETELLVEEALNVFKPAVSAATQLTLLDIGTGSGAIAIALAKELHESIIYAADISRAALAVARANSTEQGYAGRIRFVCGDSVTPFRQKELFDLIVSNPPYIRSGDLKGLAREIREHEPIAALDGGIDGLDFYRQWIPQMPALLRGKGWVILEMGAGQAAAVAELFQQTGLFNAVKVVKDYAGHERVVLAQKRYG